MSHEKKARDAEKLLRERLNGRVRNLSLAFGEKGVVLRGYAFTYYAKQLAQHTAMKELDLTVVANEIEVRGLLAASP